MPTFRYQDGVKRSTPSRRVYRGDAQKNTLHYLYRLKPDVRAALNALRSVPIDRSEYDRRLELMRRNYA